MVSHSIFWHLLHVVYNILNMQRYATSVAGQTCCYGDRRRRQAASSSWKHSIVTIVRQFYRTDMASLAWPTRRQATLGKLARKMCGPQQDFWHEKSTKRPQQTCKVNKSHSKPKPFGSARTVFGFERTAETTYQRSQCYGKGKPRDFERPH